MLESLFLRWEGLMTAAIMSGNSSPELFNNLDYYFIELYYSIMTNSLAGEGRGEGSER